MKSVLLRIALVSLLVASAPTASGQGPNAAPTAALEIILDDVPPTGAPGDSFSVPANVTLRLGNFACPTAATISVPLTLAPSSVASMEVEPGTLEFNIGVGAFLNNSYTQTRPATLSATVRTNLANNATLTLNLTASFSGGAIGNCQSATPFPPATAWIEKSTEIVVSNASTGSADVTRVPEDEDSPRESPALGWIVLAAALMIVAMRRR